MRTKLAKKLNKSYAKPPGDRRLFRAYKTELQKIGKHFLNFVKMLLSIWLSYYKIGEDMRKGVIGLA